MRADLRGTRVLVTGAAGFIGSHLVQRLAAEGAEVHGLDRAGASSAADGAAFHRLDLSDAAGVRALLEKVRPVKVYHLAGHTNVERGFDTVEASVNDLRCTLNLLGGLRDAGTDCFVQTGTCEEYGDQTAPFREDQPCNPVSAYSAAKSAATLFCRMFHKTAGLPVVVLRPFLTYGPGQDEARFVPRAIVSALTGSDFPMTGGEQTRELNYVSDIVDGFVRASVTPGAIGEIINIGNGEEHTLKQVVEMISRIAGRPVPARFGMLPYRPGEAGRFYCDHTKARNLLGWSPRMDLETGLRRTVEWYRSRLAGRSA